MESPGDTVPRAQPAWQWEAWKAGTEVLWDQGTELQRGSVPWCTTALSSIPWWHSYPADEKQGMKCLWIFSEVWNTGRGGKRIREMEKNTATPQRRYGEIPDEKMVFHWRKWTRREKAHKKSNEKKAKYIISSPFCFPSTPQSSKAEPILFLAF